MAVLGRADSQSQAQDMEEVSRTISNQHNDDHILLLASDARVPGTSRVEAPVLLRIKVNVSTEPIARQKGVCQDPSFAIKWRSITMIYKAKESIVFSRSSSRPSMPSDLTTIEEGDHNVSLFPISPAKFHRHNVGPEPPRLSEDFVKLWSWDGVVVA